MKQPAYGNGGYRGQRIILDEVAKINTKTFIRDVRATTRPFSAGVKARAAARAAKGRGTGVGNAMRARAAETLIKRPEVAYAALGVGGAATFGAGHAAGHRSGRRKGRRETTSKSLETELHTLVSAGRKTKAREAILESKVMRANPGMRAQQAENDYAMRSDRKVRGFTARLNQRELDGSRTERPGMKTSLPRARSLTPEARGVLGTTGERAKDYQLTGNPRVRKSYGYDPENKRQRRLGAAQAALLLGAGVAGYRGGRGAIKTTRALRDVRWNSVLPKGHHTLAAKPRDLALLGGSVAGIGGAVGIHRHADSPRGRTRL